MTSSVPAFDDPAALAALLKKWSAPEDLHEVLTQKGFKTIASVAFAIPAQGSPDDFLRVLWPPPDPSDTTALVTPSASFARRLLVQSRALIHPSGPAPATPSSTSPDPNPAPKITAEAAETLRQKFMENYPGEILSPANTPSVEFLSRLRSELDKPTTLWIPWRLRTSEQDLQNFYDTRRPRTDGQILRHILDGIPEPVAAQTTATVSGPVEPALRRHCGLLVTALAFLGDLHLRPGKTFLEAFVSTATAAPLDSTLRPPSLQEALSAEKSVWAAIASLMRDEKWSLSDALHEVSVTRHMMPTLLCARPRSMTAPPFRDTPGRGSGSGGSADRPDPNVERPPKKPRKDKGAATAPGKKPVSELWDSSWANEDESGREICKRFVLGRCKLSSCKFSHTCPIMMPSGKPCGQKHTAAKHMKTAH